MSTWSHEILRQTPARKGVDVTVRFTRDETGDIHTCTFHFALPGMVATSGPARLAQKKNGLELGWSALNGFDLGDEGGESKKILWKLVTAIRNNPGLTVTQATGWYDTNYPDALYRGVQLLLKMRQWIEKETGYIPTWDQFKTYVINNVFEAIDG